MNTNYLVNALNRKQNGSFFKVRYTSTVPVNANGKAHGHIVTKTVTSTVRKGIKYSNLIRVKKQVMPNYTPDNAKEYAQIAKTIHRELPFGTWMKGYEGLLIEHTTQKGIYNQYVRLYATPNKPVVEYQLNGNPISIEELKELHIIGESYWNPKTKSDTFTINVANIEKVF